MSRLTTVDLEVLEAFLNRNDRAGFYIKYYDLTKGIDPEGARLARS